MSANQGGKANLWIVPNIALAIVLVAGLVAAFVLPGMRPADKAEPSETVQPVTLVFPTRSLEEAATDQAGALMIRQYVHARLVTEQFLTIDFTAEPSEEEVAAILEEALTAWDEAAVIVDGADQILSAVAGPSEEGSDAASGLPGAEVSDSALPTGSATGDMEGVFFAQPVSGQFPMVYPMAPPDPVKWAEEFTKQYDQTKGNKKLQTLAAQMRQDVKDIHKQLEAAQEILRTGAVKDAEFWDKMTKAAMATKTAAKVGLFVGATIATAGGAAALAAPTAAGSLAIAASSGGVGLAGAASIVINGADVMVEVEATTSAIVLGEDHKVTVELNKLQDYTGPLAGATLVMFPNPEDTVGLIEWIGNNIMDYVSDDRVFGFKSEVMFPPGTKKLTVEDPGAVQTTAVSIPAGTSPAETEENLAAVGMSLPPEQVKTLEEAIAELNANFEEAKKALEATGKALGIDWTESGGATSESSLDSAVVGTYTHSGVMSWQGFSDEGDPILTDIDPTPATVTLEGDAMTISIHDTRGTTFVGVFDASTGVFTGADTQPKPDDPWALSFYQLGQVTITFDTAANPVTASGWVGDETASISMSFTKTGP